MSLTSEQPAQFLCEKVKASQACFAPRIYISYIGIGEVRIFQPKRGRCAHIITKKKLSRKPSPLPETSVLVFFSLFWLKKSVCLATNKKLVFFSIKKTSMAQQQFSKEAAAGARQLGVQYGFWPRLPIFRIEKKLAQRRTDEKQKSLTKDEKNLFVFIWLLSLIGQPKRRWQKREKRYEWPQGTTTTESTTESDLNVMRFLPRRP